MQHETVNGLTIQQLSPESTFFVEAVGRATDSWRDATPTSRIHSLLDDARRRGLKIEPVLGLFDGNRLIFACLAIESPGHAALVFAPWSHLDTPSKARAELSTLKSLIAAMAGRRVRLLEALLPTEDVNAASHLSACEFRYLTQLIYIRRRVDAHMPVQAPSVSPALEWLEYTPEREPLFTRGLELSYHESLDCPELSTLRTTADILAGHKAVGDFDASIWLVACQNTEPVGVLLLSRIAQQVGLEIVYMGVASAARGKGVGDALLARAVAEGRRLGVSHLALAVDKRNAPARRLYARWGFVELARRDAWIATPSVATG